MTTVLKIGGSVLEPEPSPALIAAVARARAAGKAMVIVHGGGKALSALLGQLGVPTEFRQGLRVTTPATLRAAVMALAGEVNKRLVAALNADGDASAIGLSGIDAACVLARVEQPELGAVGVVTRVAPQLLRTLLAAGFLPVLASLASDGSGGALNVNADQFAAAVAASLGADRLLFVTDVAGVLDESGQLLPNLTLAQLEAMSASGALRGGMLPKAAACRAALAAGVGSVKIIGAETALRLDQLLAGEPCPATTLHLK